MFQTSCSKGLKNLKRLQSKTFENVQNIIYQKITSIYYSVIEICRLFYCFSPQDYFLFSSLAFYNLPCCFSFFTSKFEIRQHKHTDRGRQFLQSVITVNIMQANIRNMFVNLLLLVCCWGQEKEQLRKKFLFSSIFCSCLY